MSETMNEATTETGPVRTFWGTDYRRFAKIVREARKVQGDETADAMLAVLGQHLTIDNPAFDAARFAAGTYERPAFVGQLASALKQARHAKCAPYTSKGTEHEAKVDALTDALTDAIGPVAGPAFSGETFAKSTALATSAYGQSTEGTDDEDDELL